MADGDENLPRCTEKSRSCYAMEKFEILYKYDDIFSPSRFVKYLAQIFIKFSRESDQPLSLE